jgi:hypothetical protein
MLRTMTTCFGDVSVTSKSNVDSELGSVTVAGDASLGPADSFHNESDRVDDDVVPSGPKLPFVNQFGHGDKSNAASAAPAMEDDGMGSLDLTPWKIEPTGDWWPQFEPCSPSVPSPSFVRLSPKLSACAPTTLSAALRVRVACSRPLPLAGAFGDFYAGAKLLGRIAGEFGWTTVSLEVLSDMGVVDPNADLSDSKVIDQIITDVLKYRYVHIHWGIDCRTWSVLQFSYGGRGHGRTLGVPGSAQLNYKPISKFV